MMAPAYPILVADIGGTNARFGLVHAAGAMPSDIRKLPGENYSCLSDALKDYLRSVGGTPPRRGCIAVAGPVEEGHFILTNRPSWSTPLEPLASEYRLDRLEVINDFQALAAALPFIEPEEIRPIGEPLHGEAAAPRAVVGPGTGLGVGAVFEPLSDGRRCPAKAAMLNWPAPIPAPAPRLLPLAQPTAAFPPSACCPAPASNFFT